MLFQKYSIFKWEKTTAHTYVSPQNQLIGLQSEWLALQFGWNNILIACGSEG